MSSAAEHPTDSTTLPLSLKLPEEIRSWPLLVIVGLGVLVRVGLMIMYFPAVMLSVDSPRYARIGMPMFGDFWMPAGYPFLLRGLRAISAEMWFTIAVQHLIGLGTGIILYLAVRRLGAARWVACIPAGFALLSGDHLYLEHIVMADFLLTFLAAAGLGAAIIGLIGGVELRWLATAGVCMASAALVRSPGVVLLAVLVFCAALWADGSMRRRAVAAATALLPGLAVLGIYAAAKSIAGGEYLGLSDMRGWNLYSRVAPFADCREFQPPGELLVLCEDRKAVERPGPFGYVWDVASVPRQKFVLGPETGNRLEAFAREAILHQPVDYVRAVGLDLARYIDPTLAAPRPYSGQPRELISFGWRDAEVERLVVQTMGYAYRGTAVQLRGQEFLAAYQQIVRLGGWPLLGFCFSTIAGMIFARGSLRLGVFLFGLSGFGLYVLPVLTVSYDFRYGIPASTFVVVSGVLGALAVWQRFRVNSDR